MRREDKPATVPMMCRSCGAEIYWAERRDSGKRVPVDSVPNSDGNLVLTLRNGLRGKLLAERFDPAFHPPERRRWVSHFVSCPQAKAWRRP
jgi:hypothetical protein